MASSREYSESLVISSAHSPQVIAEYVTLCAQGRLYNSYRIEARYSQFDFVANDHAAVLGAVTARPQLETPEALFDVARVYLGLRMAGADVEPRGFWKSALPDDAFVRARLTDDVMLRDNSQSLVSDVCLSFADLAEINRFLVGQARPASELVEDAAFCAAFPAVETRYGFYGSARHRSGTEIKVGWSDDAHLAVVHGFEAPSPAEDLARLWMRSQRMKLDEEDFLEVRQNRWRLAKLLSRVPQRYKSEVYAWVMYVAFEVELFHDTKGGHYIPENFELPFGNYLIFCGRSLEFELIEG